MPLPLLFTVPGDLESLRRWFFWHQADHQEIQRAVFKQRGISLTVRVLDPVDLKSIVFWDEAHQETHNEVNGVLGINGQDLGGFNFKNPDKLREWVYQNAEDHLAQRQLLKI